MVSAQLLRNCTQLKDFPDNALEKLATIGQQHTATVNDTLFADMDPAQALMLVLEGEVRLCCELGTGELRTMDTVAAGELFAWSSLVEPFRYTSTAVAACPTKYATFDAATLRAMMVSDVDLGHVVLSQIVHLLARRLNAARSRLLDI